MELLFRPLPDMTESLAQEYVRLFAACFPKAVHFTAEYLLWLYRDNPAGAAVGFDAWDGDRLVAHYACVPAAIRLHGRSSSALLSLNTATHPDYQGRGLFTKLASQTYALGESKGYSCVFGIANANSTPGFLKKLDFKLVGALTAKLGIGSLQTGWAQSTTGVTFTRHWDFASLQWRRNNPSNPVSLVRLMKGAIACRSRGSMIGFSAYAEIACAFDDRMIDQALISDPIRNATASRITLSPLRVYLGSFPNGVFPASTYVNIPAFLRPSPLNFIFRPLVKDVSPPTMDGILLSFMDFDAF